MFDTEVDIHHIIDSFHALSHTTMKKSLIAASLSFMLWFVAAPNLQAKSDQKPKAEAPTTMKQKDPMSALAHMVGSSKGAGWTLFDANKHPSKEKIPTKGSTLGTARLGGSVLVLEQQNQLEDKEHSLLRSLAILAYDHPAKKYVMRRFEKGASGITQTDTPDVRVDADGNVSWGFDVTEIKQKKATNPMSAISYLAGQWRGKGWMMFGPNNKAHFTQTETVTAKLDGDVLLIDGLGHSADDASRVTHEAFAMIAYDHASDQYIMRSFRKNEQGITQTIAPKVSVSDGVLTWQFSDPNTGTIRYVIRENEQGQWFETGEMSRDGGQHWFPFFSMTLDRVK